jgi:hypothetical protein
METTILNHSEEEQSQMQQIDDNSLDDNKIQGNFFFVVDICFGSFMFLY